MIAYCQTTPSVHAGCGCLQTRLQILSTHFSYSSHFHNNTANGGSGDTTAVTVYRVLLSFHGNNTFISNEGGGTSLLSSRMDVRGQVTFDRNSAVFGAGVAMSGRSLVSYEFPR